MGKFKQTLFLTAVLCIAMLTGGCGAAIADTDDSANYCLEPLRSFTNEQHDISHDNRFLILKQGVCSGIVQGIASVSRSLCACIENGVTLGQIHKVVLIYLDQRPARLHEAFTGLVIQSLRNAWPCKLGR